jgi:hypothetical protein
VYCESVGRPTALLKEMGWNWEGFVFIATDGGVNTLSGLWGVKGGSGSGTARDRVWV